MGRTSSENSLVSCVVPAYNAERFIEEALESVVSQTYRPIEVVVVDDGSTDRTGSIVRDFAIRKEESVRYLRQENAGPALARNRGIAESRGEFVAFLDSDDLWREDKLELQVSRFRDRPDLDVCFAYAQDFWMEEARIEQERMKGNPRARPHPSYVAGTLLAPRALFDEVGGFDDQRVHRDVPAWYREAERRGAVVEVVEELLLLRRLHRDNFSRTATSEDRRDLLRTLRTHIEDMRATGGAKGREEVDPENAADG